MGMYFASSIGISFHFKQVKEDFMFHFEMQIFYMNWQILNFKQREPELIGLHC